MPGWWGKKVVGVFIFPASSLLEAMPSYKAFSNSFFHRLSLCQAKEWQCPSGAISKHDFPLLVFLMPDHSFINIAY